MKSKQYSETRSKKEKRKGEHTKRETKNLYKCSGTNEMRISFAYLYQNDLGFDFTLFFLLIFLSINSYVYLYIHVYVYIVYRV